MSGTAERPGMDDLVVPFMFVPNGVAPSPDWLAQHPGWVRFPATLVLRDTATDGPAAAITPEPSRLTPADAARLASIIAAPLRAAPLRAAWPSDTAEPEADTAPSPLARLFGVAPARAQPVEPDRPEAERAEPDPERDQRRGEELASERRGETLSDLMEPMDRLLAYRAASGKLRALEPGNPLLNEWRTPRLPAGSDLDRVEDELKRAQARRADQLPTQRNRPEGMPDDTVYARWKEMLSQALREGGITDAQVFLRGSAVTGSKFVSGLPFDTDSDYDLAIVSPALFARAKTADIPTRGGGQRTGPLTQPQDLASLGLPLRLVAELTDVAGRSSSIMIYENETAFLERRQPYMILTGSSTE